MIRFGPEQFREAFEEGVSAVAGHPGDRLTYAGLAFVQPLTVGVPGSLMQPVAG